MNNFSGRTIKKIPEIISSFFIDKTFQPMTLKLAFYEWFIFLAAAVLVWRESQQHRTTEATIQNSQP